MVGRLVALLLIPGLAALPACGDDTASGTPTDTGAPTPEAEVESVADVTPDATLDLPVVDAPAADLDTPPPGDIALDDAAPDAVADAGEDAPADLADEVADAADAPADELTPDAGDDAPPPEDSYTFPEVTDDCDPLGLPGSAWAGTFDGEITSNIPDVMGYTFNGPTSGAISFDIKCINQKYVVFGKLEGAAENCALPAGCPFTADLGGFYNPETAHIHGDVANAAIDFGAVVVLAEGEFDGDLVGGTTFEGTWSGIKTDIDNKLLPNVSLEWVEASGAGSWTAESEAP